MLNTLITASTDAITKSSKHTICLEVDIIRYEISFTILFNNYLNQKCYYQILSKPHKNNTRIVCIVMKCVYAYVVNIHCLIFRFQFKEKRSYNYLC